MNTLALLFMTVSIQYHLPTGLLESLCYVESKHNIQAVHRHDGHGDSLGICQIKLSTARQMGFKGTAKDLMKPQNNIEYAAKYLDYQTHRYHDIQKAVVAYNIGNARGLTGSHYQRRVFSIWHNNYPEMRLCSLTTFRR